jgi:hypothetical protein
LCACETWSPAFTAKHKIKVFEYGVLRRIFGTTVRGRKQQEAVEDCILHQT